MQITEFTLPEDIERQKAARKKEEVVVERLNILEQPLSVSSTALEVAWRPPSLKADRVDRCGPLCVGWVQDCAAGINGFQW
jgi:hypothetical protein